MQLFLLSSLKSKPNQTIPSHFQPFPSTGDLSSWRWFDAGDSVVDNKPLLSVHGSLCKKSSASQQAVDLLAEGSDDAVHVAYASVQAVHWVGVILVALRHTTPPTAILGFIEL